MHDGWAAYNNLDQFNYEHAVVIHRENFVEELPYIDRFG